MIESLVSRLIERQHAYEPFMSLTVVDQNREKTRYTLRLIDQGHTTTFTLEYLAPGTVPLESMPARCLPAQRGRELVRIIGHQRDLNESVDILMSPVPGFIWPVLLEF